MVLRRTLIGLLLYFALGAGYDTDAVAPILVNNIPNQSATAGVAVTFNPYAYLKCGPYQGSPGQTWSVSGLPTGLAMSNTTGLVTGPPSSQSPAVTFTCQNASGTTSTNTFLWAVTGGQSGSPTPMPAAAYCFTQTGSDSGSGRYPNCWATLPKFNSTVFVAGDDVYFLAGETWNMTNGPVLTHDWSGVSEANQAVVGSYYVSGGVAYINAPTNLVPSSTGATLTYAQPRPIFQGTYRDSCRLNVAVGGSPKCAWNTSDSIPGHFTAGTAFPSGVHSPMIVITVTTGRKYQTLQDLTCQDSAGRCFGIDSTVVWYCTPGDPVCSDSNAMIQRVKSDGSAGIGISAAGVARYIVRQNEVLGDNQAVVDLQPCTRQTSNCPAGTPNPTISFRGGNGINDVECSPCEGLYEANDVHDGWGEGFGGGGTTHVLTRGNTTAGHIVGYNNAANSHLVHEQNIAMGGVAVDPQAAGSSRANIEMFWAYAMEGLTYGLSQAGGGVGVPHFNNLWRNNLSAATAAACFNVYATTSVDAETSTRMFFLGNTCATAAGEQPAGFGNFQSQYLASPIGIDIVNNLFLQGDGTCASFPSSLIDWYENQFSINPTDADCRTPGTGDVVNANTGLPKTLAQYAAATWQAPVTASDFIPAGTGAGQNVGVLYPTVIVDSGTVWDWVLAHRYWLPACNTTGAQVPKAEWLKGLTTDYCGNPRDSTPNMGAF